VDKRSDVFSFGCVLYEMPTSAGPFAGETATDSIGAVLHKDPDWSKLPADTPRLVRLLLTGPAVPFTEDIRPDAPDVTNPMVELSASRNGTLAYLPGETNTGGTLGLVSRNGTFQSLGVPPGPIGFPRVSPDGHAVAFTETWGR
jgi:serine/threonine protein kinase